MEFTRQIRLPEIGSKGHKIIRKTHFTIIGVGSLGSWAAILLGSMGAGKVTLIDRDIVDETNLYHQPLFTKEVLDKPKADSAARKLKQLFPETSWEALDIDLNSSNIKEAKADIILDCTDNLETRYLLNEWCVKNKKPWIHSAAIGVSGTVCSFLPGKACFKCLYPAATTLETCETRGIFNPVASMTASIQISEAIKIILGEDIAEGFIRINALNQDFQKITFNKNPFCTVCSQKKFELLEKKPQQLITFCGGSVYQAHIKNPLIKADYERRGPITVFKDGRILVKARSEQTAKALISRFVAL